MSVEIPYFVWRSDHSEVVIERAVSAQAAADKYSLRHRVPYGIAIRVVPVDDVQIFGIRVEPSGA